MTLTGQQPSAGRLGGRDEGRKRDAGIDGGIEEGVEMIVGEGVSAPVVHLPLAAVVAEEDQEVRRAWDPVLVGKQRR